MLSELPFKEIWAVDFEFNGKPGDRPKSSLYGRPGAAEGPEPSTLG